MTLIEPRIFIEIWIFCTVFLQVFRSSYAGSADFAAGSQNYITLGPMQTSSNINISYTSSQPSSNTATIHDVTTDVDVTKSVNGDGSITFDTSDFTSNSLTYGIYKTTLQFSGYSLETAIVYELPITDFEVVVDPIVAIGEVVNFTAQFSQASNVEIEWHWDSSNSELDDHGGHMTSVVKQHTFTETGNYTISVVSGNTLGRMHKLVQITVQYNVNGFSATNTQGPFTTGIPINFTVSREVNASLPMGTVNMILSYGDDSANDSIPVSGSVLTQMTGSGYVRSHIYTIQGNYTVQITWQSEISSQKETLYQHIWDVISDVTLIVPPSGNLSEDISFQFNFTSPPTNGFNYRITFGDGTEIESEPSFIKSTYISPIISHAYQMIGVYTIHMLAWNPFYASECTYTIIIQTPVRDLVLTPALTNPKLMYPVPDGDVEFSYKMTVNHTDPTNVTCEHTFGDNTTPDIAFTDITFDVPIKKVYTYTSQGNFTINITCHNEVSSVELITEIEMIAITLNDFTLSYPPVVGMNMTKIAAANDIDGPTFAYDLVRVTFQVNLFRCVRFPPGIKIEYDLGDDSDTVLVQDVNVGYTFDHTYNKRGIFTLTLSVFASYNNETGSSTSTIRVGATEFLISPYGGTIGMTTFTFNVSGIGPGATYDLNIGPGLAFSLNSEPSIKTHVYPSFTKYYAYVISHNATFYEKTYTTIPVRAELALTGVNISMPSKIDLPPGFTVINVSLEEGATSLPYINCTFLSGDLIDRKLYYKVQNITASTPIVFSYNFITLGNHTAVVNCSNAVSHFTVNKTINVWNECFQSTGMFDRDYSNETNPLRLYTSQNTDLGSRMAVYCTEEVVLYIWKFYTKDENGTFSIPYNFTTVNSNSKARIRFAPGTIGTIKDDLFRVTLNVTLKNKTWVTEPTFVQLLKSPPNAMIIGGNLQSVKLNKKKKVFDALTESYDPMYGLGSNDKLSFIWTCREFTTGSIADLKAAYEFNNQLDSKPDCMYKLQAESNETNGMLSLNLTAYAQEMGYAVTVQVILDYLNATYTQLLQAQTGKAPDIGIVCSINCDKKNAIKLKTIVELKCYDCEHAEIDAVTIEWWLKKNSIIVPVAEFEAMTLTGIHSALLSLKPDKLEENTVYELWASATGGWGRTNDVSQTARVFRTNLLPYNGQCTVSPQEGNATTTAFAIYCQSFLDEGLYPLRDPVRDRNNNNPLNYRYFVVDKHGNGDETETIVRTLVFTGGEMSISGLRLTLGNPDYNYIVTIEIEICDFFGDYITKQLEIKVTPDVTLQPSDGDDTESVNKLFDVFEDAYAIIEQGGNVMFVINLCTSTASMNSNNTNIKTTVVDVTQETKSNHPLLDSTLVISNESRVQTLLKEKNHRLSGIIKSSIPSPTSTVPLLAGDCQQVARAIEEVVRNTDIVDDETSTNALSSVEQVMKNVKRNSEKRPFPMSQLSNINLAIGGVVNAVDALLNYLSNDERQDLTVPLTKEAIGLEILNNNEFPGYAVSEENMSELVDIIYKQRLQKRQRQEERAKTTKNGIGKLFYTTDTALEGIAELVQYGENATVIEKENIQLSVEKKSMETFIENGKVERSGVSLALNNDTVQNGTRGNMDLHLTVFNRSFAPHAIDDNLISSQVVKISTKNPEGEDIAIERQITLKNRGDIHSTEHDSDIDDTDSMLLFRFNVIDNNDATMAYIKLKKEIPMDADVIFTAYFKCEPYPSSTDNDYTYDITRNDLDSTFGLKVVAPGGTLKKGKCYLGLQRKPYIQTVGTESSTEAPAVRRKRSASLDNSTVDGNTTTVNSADGSNSTFSIAIFTTGCKSFNSSTSKLESNGCYVLPFSTPNETVCHCPSSVRTIATTFYVTPNTIDFSTVFSKFDIANAAVYGTLLAILILYIILAVCLRKKDKLDRLRWCLRFLVDCDSEDRYFYLISVHTGLRPGSGTDSNVNFVLAGESGDSGVRLLSDGMEHGFHSAGVRNFVMSTKVVLGKLRYFRVWHDNSGTGKRDSWYLHKIIIDDPQTNQRYLFHCDQWLSLDFDDGMIERIIPVEETENLGIESLFFQQTRTNLTENHLWLSLFVRPTRSVFTRVQRLGCGTTLLLLTMISNAMFFRSADEETVSADSIRLGFFRLSLSNLFISFVGIIITTPPIFFATYFFRNTEPKKKALCIQEKKSRLQCVSCCKRNNRNREALKINELYSNENEHFLVHKKRKFSHWVGYIAWAVLILASAASAFFLLLYSMQWGKDKSEEWLSTFILSFFESLIFVDPIKVIVIAFIVAIIFRKHVDDETTLIDMRKIKDAASKHSSGNCREFWAFRHEVLSKCEPPPEDKLNEQRKQRQLELKAKQVFREVLLYIVFAIVVYCISYVNRDNRSYRMKSNIDNLIYASNKYHFGFSKVKSMDHFMHWMDVTFVPAFYPVQEYNGASLSLLDKFYVGDLTNLRLGLVRLRQVRMPKEKCNYFKLTGSHFCTSDYQSSKEEINDYCVSWKPKNNSCPSSDDSLLTKDAYKYKTSAQLNGLPFAGEYDVYGGGGYIQDLPNNRDDVNNVLKEVRDYRWLDRKTRALLIEFSLYNANVNLIAYATFAIEFAETGVVVVYTSTQSFRPTVLNDATGAFSLICYFVYIIAILIATFKIVNKFRQNRWKYFKAVWNIIDLLTISLSFAAIGVWIAKYIETNRALQRYRDDVSGFITFAEIITWDNVYNSIIGIIVFTATLRILSALGYNKKMAELTTVVRHAAPELLSFFVIFGFGFFGFAILGYLLFGSIMYDYHNMLVASGSLSNTLIGRNSLDKMVSAAPAFAQFYFFCYVLFIIFILLTMFAAILNQSITTVREDSNKAKSPIGILDLIKGTLTDLLGMFGIHIRSNNQRSNSPKKYMQSVPKANAKIDTQNILQLVRDTFGHLNDGPSPTTKDGSKINTGDKKVIKENEKYICDSPPGGGRLSRPRTPRDVDFGFSYPSRENTLYSSYL